MVMCNMKINWIATNILRRPVSVTQRWILSFILIDVIFWLYTLIWYCGFNSDLCGVAVGFGVMGFYAPFAFLVPIVGTIDSPVIEVLTASIIGSLFHGLIGLGLGLALRNRPVRWRVSIPVAFVILFVVIVSSHPILRMFGQVM